LKPECTFIQGLENGDPYLGKGGPRSQWTGETKTNLGYLSVRECKV
jgi:hypothetical protein